MLGKRWAEESKLSFLCSVVLILQQIKYIWSPILNQPKYQRYKYKICCNFFLERPQWHLKIRSLNAMACCSTRVQSKMNRRINVIKEKQA